MTMKSRTSSYVIHRIFLAILCVAFGVSTLPHAANRSKAWTDPQAAAKEDPDFMIQGQDGSFLSSAAAGVQAVALGDGVCGY